jgi:hypothetical protein
MRVFPGLTDPSGLISLKHFQCVNNDLLFNLFQTDPFVGQFEIDGRDPGVRMSDVKGQVLTSNHFGFPKYHQA